MTCLVIPIGESCHEFACEIRMLSANNTRLLSFLASD